MSFACERSAPPSHGRCQPPQINPSLVGHTVIWTTWLVQTVRSLTTSSLMNSIWAWSWTVFTVVSARSYNNTQKPQDGAVLQVADVTWGLFGLLFHTHHLISICPNLTHPHWHMSLTLCLHHICMSSWLQLQFDFISYYCYLFGLCALLIGAVWRTDQSKPSKKLIIHLSHLKLITFIVSLPIKHWFWLYKGLVYWAGKNTIIVNYDSAQLSFNCSQISWLRKVNWTAGSRLKHVRLCDISK